MKFLQELSKMTEAAVMDAMMDTICKACLAAKCKGETYEQAVKNICAEFRKLDKAKEGNGVEPSRMSDEALKDLVMGFYNHDKHLSANDNVTSYRDVNFSRGQGPGTTPGATDGIVTNNVNQMKESKHQTQKEKLAIAKSLVGKTIKLHMTGSVYDSDSGEYEVELNSTPSNVKVARFNDEFDNDGVYDDQPGAIMVRFTPAVEVEYYDANDDKQKEEKITHGTVMIKDVDYFDEGAVTEEEGVEPAPKRDLKAEAIGIATAWLKKNYKKYNLPLKVRRVPTSGKYIMTTVAANKGEEPKRVFLKVLDGEAKQVSSKEWKMLDEADGSAAGGDMPGASGSLDNQTQGGIPSGEPDANQGPQGNEVPTPPPSNKPANPGTTSGPATRTIAKGGDFRVDLGQNEQVSIIDGKGNIRLSMPFVIWKELTRQ